MRVLLLAATTSFATLVPATPVALASPIDEQRDRVDAIVDELERLEQDAAVLAEDHIDALAERARLDTEIGELEGRLSEQQAALGELEAQLTQLALNRFTGSGTRSVPLLLESADTPALDQLNVFTRVALGAGHVTVDDLDLAVAELTATRAELDKRAERSDRLAAEIETARELNEQKQAEFQQARTQAEAELGELLQAEEERRARQSYVELVGDQQATPAGTSAPEGRASTATSGQHPAAASNGSGAAPSATPPDNAPTPEPSPAPPTSRPATPSPSGLAEVAINAALSQLGVPWVFATAQPGVGFDCSGLTSWAWRKAGVSLPHQSRAQFAALPQVPKSNAQRGDLLFYYSPISHVGIYLGNGQLVHSPNSGDTVKVSNVNWNNVTGVGRPG